MAPPLNWFKRLLFAILALASTALIWKFCSTPGDSQGKDFSLDGDQEAVKSQVGIMEPKSGKQLSGHDILLKNNESQQSSNAEKKSVTQHLPEEVINGVEKFVFFIGYPRSGHSIVGSFLDAHPHIVMAHEFMLFRKLMKSNMQRRQELLHSKQHLFDALYSSSARASLSGWRSEDRKVKNYTLSIDSQWMGKYDDHISIIGDKSGGMTANIYSESPEGFTKLYKELKETVNIPIKVIHCIRNPFDIVATNTLYTKAAKLHDIKFVSSFKSKMSKLQGEAFLKARFNSEKMLGRGIQILQNQTMAVEKITALVGPENVLEIHNSELVNDPESTLTKICRFLVVDCPHDYLRTCSEKVFKSVSKSRDTVVWSQRLREMMERLMFHYPYFHRYSFSSE